MRRVSYAGAVFYTGDRITEALLSYAGALGRNDMSETVRIPGRTREGEVGEIEVLIGPKSQLLSQPTDEEYDEIIDEDLVRWLSTKVAELGPMRAQTQSEPGAAETAAVSEQYES